MRLASLGLITGLSLPVVAFARSPEVSLLGMPFYSIGFIEATAQLVALVAFLYATKRYKKYEGWPFLRAVLLLTLKVVLVWELVWNADNLATSLWVAALCKFQGGLRVYQTVEAEGYLGRYEIRDWHEYGFRYVEKKQRKYQQEPTYTRLTIAGNVKRTTRIEHPISRYEVVEIAGAKSGYRTRRWGTVVRDTRTGEVLGELRYYLVKPGIFDSMVLSILTGSASSWDACDTRPGPELNAQGLRRAYGYDDVIKAILKPVRQGVVADENRGDL